MLVNPRTGIDVMVWYKSQTRAYAPYHGRIGRIAVTSRGKPRNHGVIFDDKSGIVVIPCGNLMPVPDDIRP